MAYFGMECGKQLIFCRLIAFVFREKKKGENIKNLLTINPNSLSKAFIFISVIFTVKTTHMTRILSNQ